MIGTHGSRARRVRGARAAGALAFVVAVASAAAAAPASAGTLKAYPAGTQGGSFTLATYNVSGLPQQLNSAATKRGPATRAIGDRLNTIDVIDVQEDFNYHSDLYATTKHQYRTSTSGGAGIGFGINTLSKLPFDASRRVAWKDCASGSGDCIGPKGFQLLRVQLAPGAVVDLYNLHTDAGSDPPDISARAGNLKQLAAYIRDNSAGHAVIVAGDTNTRYTRAGEGISSFAAESGLKDAWVTLLRGGREPGVGGGFVCDNTKITNPADCEVVDKILYRSGNGVDLTGVNYTLPHAAFSDAGGMLSDHDPVVVSFSWSGLGDPAAPPVKVDTGPKLSPVTAVTNGAGAILRGLRFLFGGKK